MTATSSATGLGERAVTTILVVEDEPSISDIVTTALRHHGYDVTPAHDGQDALRFLTINTYDLVVLDVMLPGVDGFEICERMRQEGNLVPVLFLTARDGQDDRITGFVKGGDDYLTKPFSIDELTLRVTAILRRTQDPHKADQISIADLQLDVSKKHVTRSGETIDLSPTEFRLLHYLMTNANVVLSKAQILVNVWDFAFDGSDNVVELYVSYLRRKIDKGRRPLIHTRRGHGYMLSDSPQ